MIRGRVGEGWVNKKNTLCVSKDVFSVNSSRVGPEKRDYVTAYWLILDRNGTVDNRTKQIEIVFKDLSFNFRFLSETVEIENRLHETTKVSRFSSLYHFVKVNKRILFV